MPHLPRKVRTWQREPVLSSTHRVALYGEDGKDILYAGRVCRLCRKIYEGEKRQHAAICYLRMLGLDINSEGERDTSKFYVAPVDSKHNIQTLELDDNGVLLAINAEPKQIKERVPFKPAPKPAPLNPRDYMNEDVLSAGSSAKMAELCALEIYDIRDSRSLLSKGQADFMPKDGEQLKIMMRNLDEQESGLMQLFTGVTVKDTIETEIVFVPNKETDRQLLFRFSKWMA